MADDIIDRLCEQAQAPALAWLADAATEIERLRAELEQATINQRHARTGQALLDLEREQARHAHLRSAFAELTDLCQRLLTERFNDMTEARGDTPTPTPTPTSTRIDL